MADYSGLLNSQGSAQKRTLRIIYPDAWSYMEALQIAKIARIKKRRDDLCVKYMDNVKFKDHPLHFLFAKATH